MRLIVIAIFLSASCYGPPPDFVEEKYNISVWTDGIEEITPELIRESIDILIEVLPECYYVDDTLLAEMFDGSWFKFFKEKLKNYRTGERDVSGYYNYSVIYVWWNNDLLSTAYYHEIIHMVMAVILRQYDYEHLHPIWACEVEIGKAYAKLQDS